VFCVVVVLIIAALVVVDHQSARLQNIFSTLKPTPLARLPLTRASQRSEIRSQRYLSSAACGGVGTAGPASVYNPKRIRIAEDYYIQIGQETGIVGLGLFLAINICVGYRLWERRSDALALGLFASFLGLVIVNLFSHAWADPTLAYLWWA